MSARKTTPQKPRPAPQPARPGGRLVLPPAAAVSFGRRVAAMLLDGMLLFFFTAVLSLAIALVSAIIGMFRPYDPPVMPGIFAVSGLILSILYFTLAWTRSGQTIGHSLLGARVLRTDGKRLSWGRALLRYLGYIVGGIVLSIGFLWAAFDRRGQAWHDKFAGTLVVDADDKFSTVDQVDFSTVAERKGWGWLVVWVILLILAPGTLLGSLWLLGPAVGRLLANLVNR